MLFHLNDSKEPCGGIGHGIDRHWEIYHGNIDKEYFEQIVAKSVGKNKVYIVQETPYNFEFFEKFVSKYI
jgi:endonuclease IV